MCVKSGQKKKSPARWTRKRSPKKEVPGQLGQNKSALRRVSAGHSVRFSEHQVLASRRAGGQAPPGGCAAVGARTLTDLGKL